MSLTPEGGPHFLRARLPLKVWIPILLVAMTLIAAATVYLAPADDSATTAAGEQEITELGGAIEADEEKNGGNPTIFEDPASFIGNPIHFFVEVGEVVDPYSVRVLSPDPSDLDLLVVYNGNPALEEGVMVEVEGVVEEFTPAKVGEILGGPLPSSTFDASTDEVALIAQTMVPAKAPKGEDKEKAPVELAAALPVPPATSTATSVPSSGSSYQPTTEPSGGTTSSSEPAPSGSSGSGGGTGSGGGGTGGGGSGGGSSNPSGGGGSGGGSGGSPAVAFTSGSASAGQYSDEVSLSARLTDAGGDPIEGARLTFTLQNGGSFSARTEGNGVATASPTLKAQPGSYDLVVTYDGARGTASDRTGFEVTKEETALDLTTEDDEDDDQGNEESTLIAELVDADSSAAIAERTVEFFVDGELIGTATTDGNGVATFEVPGRYKKEEDFEARFSVDEFYLTSQDSV